MGWNKLKVTANENAGAGVLYVRMANGDLSHAAQPATEFAALAFLEALSNSGGQVLPDRSEAGARFASAISGMHGVHVQHLRLVAHRERPVPGILAVITALQSYCDNLPQSGSRVADTQTKPAFCACSQMLAVTLSTLACRSVAENIVQKATRFGRSLAPTGGKVVGNACTAPRSDEASILSRFRLAPRPSEQFTNTTGKFCDTASRTRGSSSTVVIPISFTLPKR